MYFEGTEKTESESPNNRKSSLALIFLGIIGIFLEAYFAHKSQSSQSSSITKKTRRVKPVHLMMTVVTAAISINLTLFGIFPLIIPEIFPGGGFWVTGGFYLIFTFWFGIWGVIGSYISAIIATWYFSGNITTSIISATGEIIFTLIPLIVFRMQKGDVGLRDARSRLIWLVIIPISSAVAGLWTNSIDLLFNIISLNYWFHAISGLFLADAISSLIVATPLIIWLCYLVNIPLYISGCNFYKWC